MLRFCQQLIGMIILIFMTGVDSQSANSVENIQENLPHEIESIILYETIYNRLSGLPLIEPFNQLNPNSGYDARAVYSAAEQAYLRTQDAISRYADLGALDI